MHRLANFTFIASLILLSSCGEQESLEKINALILHNDTIDVHGNELKTFVLPDEYQKRTPWISTQAGKAAEADLYRNDEGNWALRYRSFNGKEALDYICIDSDVKPSESDKEDDNDLPLLFGQQEENRESCVESVQRLQLLVRVFSEANRKSLNNTRK